MNQKHYRMLALGEQIRATDEVVGYDDDGWSVVHDHLVGREVWSDWRMAGNLKFRRHISPPCAANQTMKPQTAIGCIVAA